mmetsp:Transcript_14631/g.37224  ORF Transcript_14631/g.37224 Transcript_14631/m.37224 type:complete len:297 (-) Transcript_14631:151-1041(-)
MFNFCCTSRPDAGTEMAGDSEIETTYRETTSDLSEEGDRESRIICLGVDLDNDRIVSSAFPADPSQIFGQVLEERLGQQEEVLEERLGQQEEGLDAVLEHGEEEEAALAETNDLDVEVEAQTGPRRFKVTVDKGSLGLNISVDSTGIGVLILEIKPAGSMDNYNKAAPERKKVRACDVIIGVNGATEMQDMLDRMKSDSVLNFQMIRPEPMWVKVRRANKPWGLNLTYQNISSHVEIVDVVEGAIDDYNQTAQEDMQVRAKDFIESANGMIGVEKIVKCLKTSASEIDLKILRFGL